MSSLISVNICTREYIRLILSTQFSHEIHTQVRTAFLTMKQSYPLFLSSKHKYGINALNLPITYTIVRRNVSILTPSQDVMTKISLHKVSFNQSIFYYFKFHC